MKLRPTAVSAGCAVTAALALGGCSSSGGAAAASSATGATAAAATEQAAGGSASTVGSSSGSNSTAGAGGVCQVSDLAFALGAKSAGTGDTVQTVDLTNKGSAACTVDGFPGLDLVGSAHGQSDYRWPLERSNDAYSKLTLQPGSSAHFSVMYLAFTAGSGTEISVTSMTITPPNTYSSTQLPWSVDVLLQDAATHPGTFITPLVAGS